jgi:hypothetical protein
MPPGGQLSPHSLQLANVPAAYQCQIPADPLHRPVPPGEGAETGYGVVVEAVADHLGGVAADNGVVGHISGDHGAGGDDGAVADPDPRHDQRLIAYPDVVADKGISLVRQRARCGGGALPAVAEDEEGVGGEAGALVVGTVHDELDPAGDGAELADDELVADEGEVIEDVALKACGILRVVVVAVVAHLDIGPLDGVLDKAHLGKAFHGVGIGGIGTVHGMLLSSLGFEYPNGTLLPRATFLYALVRQALSSPAYVRIDPERVCL